MWNQQAPLQMTYQWFVSIPMLLGAPKKAGEK
jgi:hypothetical protein